MISLKRGVRVTHLTPQGLLAIQVVDAAYGNAGVHTCVVTSVDDSQHGATTLHGKGLAVDFRLHNVPGHLRPALVEHIKLALAGDPGFELYWENVGEPGEHLHLEYDVKD